MSTRSTFCVASVLVLTITLLIVIDLVARGVNVSGASVLHSWRNLRSDACRRPLVDPCHLKRNAYTAADAIRFKPLKETNKIYWQIIRLGPSTRRQTRREFLAGRALGSAFALKFVIPSAGSAE